MRVLIACERSGVVRLAFRLRGHEAYSCDILPDLTGSPWHIVGDAWVISYDQPWDLMIAHPPCTHLCCSGARHFKYKGRLQADAVDFVQLLWDSPIPKVAIENPIGVLSSEFRKPSQIIQPYQFGHDISKATCLWLRGLPILLPTDHVPPKEVVGDDYKIKRRWSNQCINGGQDKTPPSRDRAFLRARTYEGIADAMAEQWG